MFELIITVNDWLLRRNFTILLANHEDTEKIRISELPQNIEQ